MKRVLIIAVPVVIVFLIGLGIGGYFVVRFARNHWLVPITVEEMLALQKKGEAAAPEIPRLIACFERDNEDLRLNAAMTLGAIGPKAIEPVRERLTDPNPKVRFCAVETLGFIKQPAVVAVDDLVERLRDDSAKVRFKTVFVLGNLEVNNPAVTEGIVKAMSDTDADVATTALDVVRKMDAPPPSALPALTKLARDPKHETRMDAIKLLGKMKEAAAPAFKDLLAAAPAHERAILLEAAVPLGPHAKPLLPIIETMMTKNRWWDGEEHLFVVIKSCGADGADTLVKVLKTVHEKNSPHFDVGDDRADTLLVVLGQIGPPAKNATPHLIIVLNDRPSLRRATLATLGDIGPSAKDAIPAVRKLANDAAVGPQARIALRRMGVLDAPD